MFLQLFSSDFLWFFRNGTALFFCADAPPTIRSADIPNHFDDSLSHRKSSKLITKTTMSDDDDFVPPAEELDDGVEAVEHSVQRRQSKRAKTQPKSYAEGKRGSYKLTNEQLLADIAATKRLRGSKALTTNEALIVIHAYQRLKLKRQTPSKGRPSKRVSSSPPLLRARGRGRLPSLDQSTCR